MRSLISVCAVRLARLAWPRLVVETVQLPDQ
jgi:hypothetical protein